MEASGSSVSVATNGDRVADIRPLSHIQTVQVEVEPNVEDGEDGKVDEETPPAAEGEEDEPSMPPLPVQLSEQPPHPEPQSTPMSKKDVPGLGRLSPPALPTVAEGLQEAGRKAAAAGKKSKKAKALSTRDLLPLHKDVGRSNKQLLEPATPEFKPTAEWVLLVYVGTVHCFMTCLYR